MLVTEEQDVIRDLAALPVPLAGALQETGDPWEPYRIVDAGGEPVASVAEFFRDLQAAGRSEATLRSYGHDLLRWFRFIWAAGVPWNRATRIEARDFCRWMLVAGKPSRPHWRSPDATSAASGEAYAPSVRAHSETVLRCFYQFHLEAGSGPVINPFPLDRTRRGGRAHAHHNPMEPFRHERSGLYRPRVPSRIPAVSRTRSSTRSSPGCPRTGTGPWSPSTSRPAPAPRSCCRRRWPASIPAAR